MKLHSLVFLTVVGLGPAIRPAFAQTAAKKTSTAKPSSKPAVTNSATKAAPKTAPKAGPAPSPKTGAKTAATKKLATAKPTSSPKAPVTASRTGKTGKGKAPVKRAAFQPRQSAPTPDRLKEIQGALAAKGYLKSEPSGVWNAESIDAMKRYQADQKLDPSGKITAASLIGLGLGSSTAAPLPPVAPTQP